MVAKQPEHIESHFLDKQTHDTDKLQFIKPEQISVAHINLRFVPFSQALMSLEYAVGERKGLILNRQKLHRVMASFAYIF